jgi:peptidylprolyl isomerase
MSSNINPFILKKSEFFIEKFFQDYFDVKWQVTSSPREITFSFPSSELRTTSSNETKDVVKNFTDPEKQLIIKAIDAWDDPLDKIKFKLVENDINADLTFGFTDLDGVGGIKDTWSASVNSNLIQYAIIEFDASDIISNNELLTKVLNSLGNILGLGDIRQNNAFDSVMEIQDINIDYSNKIILSDFDKSMIRSIYDESSFLSKSINTSEEILTSHDNSENIILMEITNGDSIGLVRIELLPKIAPNHVKQIKTLVNDDFYDGLYFHRVIDGFMAQTGDPNGDGTGGSTLNDIDAEFSFVPYERGTVGMARSSDPDSANSQFFITFQEYPSLDNNYTVFGKVIEGMEYIDGIKRGEPPSDPDKVISMSVSDFEQFGIINYSNTNDIIISTGGHKTYRGLMGDDTFFISHLLKENNKITIVDTDGQNTIQIPSNTYIDDILFTKNAARLTFEDNREITISGADKFIYNLSGNVTSGKEGYDLSYTDFASIFGVEGVLDLSSSQTGTITDMYIL